MAAPSPATTPRPVDEAEIRAFVDEEYSRVVAAVAMATGDRANAEDAVQEAMVKAWQQRQEIRSLGAWITVAATNGAHNAQRSRGAEARATDRLGAAMSTAPTGTSPEDAVTAPAALRDALRELPPRQRECVVLRYYLDHSVADCAAAMAVTEGTVKTSLHRARAALEAALRNEPGAPS